MENGKAKQLLDRIQDIVGDGQNVPFAAGKVLVNNCLLYTSDAADE